jgi:hypothetical protein
VEGAWNDKRHLLTLAMPHAEEELRKALIARLRDLVENRQWILLSNEADYFWDDDIAQEYLHLVREASGDSLGELVSTLVSHDVDMVRPVLLEWLAEPDGQRRGLAAQALIDRDLEHSWPGLRSTFDGDLQLAEEVIGRSERAHGFRVTDDLSPALRAELYLWLRERFPPEEDPTSDEVHFVGPREQLGQWRERLLHHLIDEGSAGAVDAVRTIATGLPDEGWLGRALAGAEASFRRRSWKPTSISLLLRLAQDGRAVLVNDTRALAAAVTSALEEIQRKLTGATPRSHLLWDTHSKRPKHEDEISDYLGDELERLLVERGVVVNREVQVRRTSSSGIGERIDLLADATPDGSVLGATRVSVPIEVKGAWNPELSTAMKQQLVGRYMRDLGVNDGVYVVLWPGLEGWAGAADGRRRKVEALREPDVRATLAAQAAALGMDGTRVHVVHLSIAYGRRTGDRGAHGV